MSSAIATKTGIFLLKQVARLPFSLLYLLSNFLFFLIYHVIGYRKDVVVNNLQNVFPEKSKSEILTVTRKYYRHLADLIVETIKMNGMTKSHFDERMVFKNPEIINSYFDKQQSVVVLTMHYNNWEWSSCVSHSIKHRILGVYKPLHNSHFDEYLNRSRKKMGSDLVSNSHLLRTLIKAEKKREPVFIWLAADQTPPFFHKFWMMFLNQETMFYPGPASISKRFNYPVFFQKITKTARGKYESEFELLVENPADKTEVEIMRAYIQKMEKVIRKQPEYYLWSHKRWKNKRPEDVPVL